MEPNRLDRLTLRAGASIREALEAIQAGGVEICLVVDETRRLIGVVTDGDIRRALLSGHGLESRADVCINTQFHAVGPHVGRAEALDLMRARGFSQLPIVGAAGRLAGLHLLRELLGTTPRLNHAVIMAGGEGLRLRPVTARTPKPMIPVAGRPILERLILHLMSFGIRRIHLAVHYKSDIIEEHFGNGTSFGCEISYLRESTPLGSAGAITLLPEPPVHPLLVLNGDLVTQLNIDELLAFHESGGFAITMCGREYAVTVPFGVVDLGADGRVAGLREKPTEVFTVNAGIYVLSPDCWAALEFGVPLTMVDVLQRTLDAGRPPGLFLIEGEWTDVGRHDDLDRVRGGG